MENEEKKEKEENVFLIPFEVFGLAVFLIIFLFFNEDFVLSNYFFKSDTEKLIFSEFMRGVKGYVFGWLLPICATFIIVGIFLKIAFSLEEILKDQKQTGKNDLEQHRKA